MIRMGCDPILLDVCPAAFYLVWERLVAWSDSWLHQERLREQLNLPASFFAPRLLKACHTKMYKSKKSCRNISCKEQMLLPTKILKTLVQSRHICTHVEHLGYASKSGDVQVNQFQEIYKKLCLTPFRLVCLCKSQTTEDALVMSRMSATSHINTPSRFWLHELTALHLFFCSGRSLIWS